MDIGGESCLKKSLLEKIWGSVKRPFKVTDNWGTMLILRHYNFVKACWFWDIISLI